VAAGGSWIWQYAFPSGIRSVDAADSVIRRHQLEEEEEEKKIVQRAFAAARAIPTSNLVQAFAPQLSEAASFSLRRCRGP